MKRFHITQSLSILAIIMLMLACNKPPPVEPEPEPAPIDKLPPLTQQGLDTFGCLIDGEAFVARVDWSIGGVVGVWSSFNEDTRLFLTQGTRETGESNFEDVRIKAYLTDGAGEYRMSAETDSFDGYNGYGGMCTYYHDPSNLGSLNISYLNEESNIISGTFEMTLINSDCPTASKIEITEGRFDLRY
jgi:hypothetical protein